MFDVVLCSDVNHNDFVYGRPVAIYRLASHLRDHGFRVKTVNLFSSISNDEFKQLVNRFVSNTTVLFGISATVLRKITAGEFFGISDADLVTRLDYVKQCSPQIKFVLGGGQVNNTPADQLKEFSMFDYAITGQGETALLKLVQHLTQNTKLTTTSIERPRLITDTTYPFTEFNQTSVRFVQEDDVVLGEALPLELARGCVFKCKFCSYDLTNKNFFEFTKNKDVLRAELVYNYQQFGTQYYSVVDDLINDSEEKVDMLLEVVESLPFPIYISGYCRLDLIWRFPSMADKLRRIGLIACFMGLETINDASGRAVGKGLGRQRMEQALEVCKQAWGNQVFVHGNFILGLPKDTVSTATELIDWGTQMLESGMLHSIYVAPMSINPWLGKADIDKNPQAFGYSVDVTPSNNHRTRFIGQEASWSTADYNFDQAKHDTEICNNIFTGQARYYGIDVFNIPFVLSMFDDSLRTATQQMLSQPVNSKKRDVLQFAINKSVVQYQHHYLAKLLGS